MRAVWLLALAGCAIPPAPEQARFWVAETFFQRPDPDDGFAGFAPSRLAVKAGEPVPWRPGTTASADALVVHPAYADGAPAAYVVTELWQGHPDPWVQPVYVVVTEYDATSPNDRRAGQYNVFGIGTDSTFYSPFWRAVFAVKPEGAVGPFTTVREVASFVVHEGGMVMCPIVPERTGISGGFHPFTDAVLGRVNFPQAYVNGGTVSYLHFTLVDQEVVGANRDLLAPVPMYFFVQVEPDGARALLDVPAVLPRDARRHAYVRRVDAPLTPDEMVFVPASRPDLKAELGARLNVPDADPAIPDDVARAHLLRVAKNGACFQSAAAFPQGCEWLDSPAAVEAHFGPSRLVETDVTLSASAVLLP